MRVAIITESFLPEINGVTNSVLRVLDHLRVRGHEALVVASGEGPGEHVGVPVVRVRSVPLPMYRSFALGLPDARLRRALRDFLPDVVHLASPVALGVYGARVAARLGLPAVAVYQTDVAGFARRYGLRGVDTMIWHWLRGAHKRAALTLAPSTAAMTSLRRRGIGPLALWPRGVDSTRFSPTRRRAHLRRALAPDGEVLVGYVGRLAPEKRLHLLAEITGLPGCRLVITGTGPLRARLAERLPQAVFLGFREGAELAEIHASLDVFVHPGADETFCQAAQEALASGVPVVAAASGGLVDLVRHEVNGLLWPPDDPAALRAAVAGLVHSPQHRTRLAAGARASVAARTWEKVGDQLIEHYRAVIAATPREPAAA